MSGAEYVPFAIDRTRIAAEPASPPQDDERFDAPLQEAKFQRFRDERQQPPTETLAALAALAAPPASPALPWDEGLQRLRWLPVPHWMTVVDWDRLIWTAQELTKDWGAKAHGLGWTTLEMFGCHRRPRAARLDNDGLAMCIFRWQAAPLQVIDIEPNLAVLRTQDGRSTLRYRRYYMESPVPIWEAFSSEAGP